MYQEYPNLYQIRKNCIVSYTDNSYCDRRSTDESKKEKIKPNGKFSLSAQKKLKKILDIWTYSLEEKKPKYSFITLTISAKVDNKCNHYKLLKQWLEIMQTRYKNVNYAWKCELQENGNPHYHLIFDIEMCWKNVRKQWNKVQKEYVDVYQIKMKEKYKNGYYYDEKMVDKYNEKIDDKTQYERWKKGTKANWRNPNSTDCKIIDSETENVNGYVSKYVGKIEEDKSTDDKLKINRWYGTNDKLKQIKYAVLSSENMYIDTIMEMNNKIIKEIKENHKTLCKIHDKTVNKQIESANKKQIDENINILWKNREINTKLIERDQNNYKKLFE